MKFDHSSGALIANKDMNTPNAIGCMAYYFAGATKLLVTITYNTGTTELVSFDVSSSLLSIDTLSGRLKFAVSGYT